MSDDGRLIDEPEADVCVWTERPLTVMEAKLGCLAVLHLMMAMFFWCDIMIAGDSLLPSPVLSLMALTNVYACLQQSDHPTLRRSVLLSVP